MNEKIAYSLADTLLFTLGLTEQVGVRFIDDQEMERMNSLYRGIDKTTDVLSFSADESNFAGGDYLGDIAISLEKALVQARECGHRVEEEIAILMVHGVLHLLDYDHELGVYEAREMAELEMSILSGLQHNPLLALIGRSI